MPPPPRQLPLPLPLPLTQVPLPPLAGAPVRPQAVWASLLPADQVRLRRTLIALLQEVTCVSDAS